MASRKTLKLDQYQCQRCKRMFYVNSMDRNGCDLDLGCPYGCDDAGQYVRNIRAKIAGMQNVGGD